MSFVTCVEVRSLKALCDEVASPFSQKILRLVEEENWVALASVKLDPRKYGSAAAYLGDAQCASLLKKLPSLPVPPETAKTAAIKAFWAAEHQCYRTNERLGPLLSDFDHYGASIGRILRLWRKEIRSVLRSRPSPGDGRFGPGSTYSNKGDLITLADKFDENYTATNEALKAFASHWDRTGWSRFAATGLVQDPSGVRAVAHLDGFELSPLQMCGSSPWGVRDFALVRGNRFTTVPKTAMTDRGIAVEASLNVWYQLSAGSQISRQLRRSYGWSKVRAQRLHRLLAKRGSITGRNATIDLKSASDTVSATLIKLLLPAEWFDFLNQLRTTHTLIQGKWARLEKFSSMGNGFTFELETLVFFTLAKVIAKLRGAVEDSWSGAKVSAFGDDLIVPVEIAEDLISALRFFGFEINLEKSFIAGQFRESCGGDYFAGVDVRPHFQKSEVTDPARAISFANGLKRFYERFEKAGGHPTYHAYQRVLNSIPRAIRRCKGPVSLGDLVIRDDDESSWDTVVRGSIRYIRVWRPVMHRPISLERHYRPGVVYATALYLAGTRKASVTERTLSLLDSGKPTDWELQPRIRGSYVSGYRFGRVPHS